MDSPLQVAVIGVGHLGRWHAKNYFELPQAKLVGICDNDSSKNVRAEELGVPFYTKYQDLFNLVDAVSIATPTSTHYAIAKDFLQKGIHTLIEKPITLRLEEADELLEIARKNNCALRVGHVERHNAGYKRIEEIANDIRFFEIHRLGPFTGRINDCGVVLDLMIHDIDIVLGLVKSKVESFDAVGVNVITPYEDIANVRLKFKNGAIANLTASRLTPEKQRKIRIFQEDAYVSLDYEAQSAKIFRKQGSQISQESVDIQKTEPLKEELKYFLEKIKTGESLGRPDEAARDALALALDIIENIKKNHENSVFTN
ncbi:MAG: Gfo/Idh/MocA family oxidoreductase [Candidatus Omnitrophica bacterium]|nr:Gfo/Idh/MocA family oxidoreductase [Candidatus Omnitrophota bacterium]